MKLNLFATSSPETESSKKPLMTKLITTAITTIVMAAATLFFSSHNQKSLLQSALPADGEEVTAEIITESAPRGLTRQRTDFEKAINILAQGVESDPRLAEYYSRVQKRVQGEAAKHENGSGVRAVKVTRKINPPSDSKGQAGPASRLKGFAEGSMVAEPEAAQGPASSAQVETLSAAATTNVSQSGKIASSRLTVGDMAYETNPAIDRWVNWYTQTTGGRRTMTIGIERSDAYLRMARSEFRKIGLPEDLVWLAHVESVWNPNAVSPAAAGGLW